MPDRDRGQRNRSQCRGVNEGMDRRAIGLICAIAGLVTVAGCTPASHGAQASPNPARWAIHVPPGWHMLRFGGSNSGARSAGVQLSNVRLPDPVLLPRTPAEVNSEALPAGGVGLVIATATGHIPAYAKVALPPLPPPWPDGSRGWLLASAPAHSPIYEWLWFRIGATTYVADAAIGWKASKAAQQALGLIVGSIKPGPARS